MGTKRKEKSQEAEPLFRSLEAGESHELTEAEIENLSPPTRSVARSQPREFSIERTIAKIRSAPAPAPNTPFHWVKISPSPFLEGLKRPGHVGAQEARFWLEFFACMSRRALQSSPQALADDLATWSDPGDNAAKVRENLAVIATSSQNSGVPSVEIWTCAITLARELIGVADAIKIAIDHNAYAAVENAIRWHWLLPIDDERGRAEEAAYARLLDDLRSRWASGKDAENAVLLRLATRSRALPILRALIPIALASTSYTRLTLATPVHEAILALDDTTEAIELIQKSPYPFTIHDLYRVVLRAGFEQLEWAVEKGLKSGFYDTDLLTELPRIHSPRLVPTMLELTHRRGNATHRKIAATAEKWLLGEGANAVDGLVSLALRRGAISTEACKHLRAIHQRGGAALLDAKLATLSEKERQKVSASLQIETNAIDAAVGETWPDWTLALKIPKGGTYTEPSSLPPLRRRDGSLLTAEQSGALLAAIGTTDFDTPRFDELRDLVSTLSPESYAGLVEHLVGGFTQAGVPKAQRWVLRAFAHVGNTRVVHAFHQLFLRQRRGSGDAAIDAALAIAKIKTPEVLWKLAEIASVNDLGSAGEKVRFTADHALTEIASARGMSRDQLAQITTPSFGLSPNGTRELSYGSRSIEVKIVDARTAQFREVGGHTYAKLPPFKSSDDPAKYNEARSEFLALEGCLERCFQHRQNELLLALRWGRSWTVDAWFARFARHPIEGHFGRTLIWAIVDQNGRVTTTVRGTEDGSLVDANNDAVEVHASSTMRLAHPIDIDEPTRKSWLMQLDDYRIMPPFTQLTRRVFPANSQEIRDLDGVAIVWGALGRLLSHGWRSEADTHVYRVALSKDRDLVLSYSDGNDPRTYTYQHNVSSITFEPPISGELTITERIALSEAYLDLLSLSRVDGKQLE